jgi:aspartyl-tRNA(Asn)/glutamyl-tRNA(Gln) amidotransferase subunit A
MANFSHDIFFATLTELNARLRAREFSCAELTQAFCDRLEKPGPHKDALRRAREIDAEMKRDRLRGPLQGVPCGVKDVFGVADATVVQKLDRAGSPLIGKLSTPESAVAAGLVPFAIGMETRGSMLIPCARSGVTGLRPTYGLVSRYGATPVAWTMDKIGPVCRSAEDCGHVLQAIAGGDSSDPSSAGKSFYYTPQFARKPSELRVAVAGESGGPAFQAALETIRGMGVRMVETRLADLPYPAVARTIIAAEGSEAPEIAAKDYIRAMRIRSIVMAELRRVFTQVDVLVSPSGVGDAENLAGLPALALPCGVADGLQLTGRPFTENQLLALGVEFQKLTDWHRRRV